MTPSHRCFRMPLYLPTFSAVTLIALILLSIPGCFKEGPTGPEGPPGGDNLSNPAILPRVIFTYPSDNAVGPFDIYTPGTVDAPHFLVRLNKLIRLSSLSDSSVSIEGFSFPVIPILYREYYYVRDASPSGFLFDDVLAFRVYQAGQYVYNGSARYEIGARYTVHIRQPLFDINGNMLAEPASFTFTPEPRFRITGFSPDTTTQISAPITNVTLTFNSPVDESIYQYLRFSPDAPEGSWSIMPYYDSVTVMYRTYEPFPLNTAHTLTVDGDAHDSRQHALGIPAAIRFTTIPFSVTQTYPPDGSINVSPASTVTFMTNGTLDTSTVRGSLVLTPPLPWNVNLLHNSNSFSINAVEEFIPSTTYTLRLSSGIRTTSGDPLTGDTSMTFTTEPMQISGVVPYDFQTSVSRTTKVNFTANVYLDTSTVRGSLSIEPAVAGRINISSYPTRSFEFEPTQVLAANTVYRITVSATLMSKSGVTLHKTFRSSFKTGQ